MGTTDDDKNENENENVNDIGSDTTTTTMSAKNNKKKVPQRILPLFSVNASGYFSGVAKMISDVDLYKNETFWQREGKFNGSFDVEWLIAKDVPFGAFGKHLKVVEDRKSPWGETKKITHSRDAQNITSYVLRQCIEVILEHETENGLAKDFAFYDEREHTRMQARMIAARMNNLHIQNQSLAVLIGGGTAEAE